jgi:phosphatidylglycerophosphate synthase
MACSLGLVLNWFGDSLDGTLARVRNAQRPIYGFYIDHNIDGLTITIMCIGAGLSPMVKFSTAMLILVGYLLLSIFTYINAYLKGEFRISYGNLGPTEFRLIVIIINTMFIYFPFKDMYLHILKYKVGIYDAVGFGIAILLFLLFLISFFVFLRKYKQVDPPRWFSNPNNTN